MEAIGGTWDVNITRMRQQFYIPPLFSSAALQYWIEETTGS